MASNGKRLNQPGAYMIDLNFQTNARQVLTQTDQIRKSVLDLAKNAQFKIGDAKELNAMTGAAVKLNQALAEAENRATGVFDLSKFNTTLRQSGTNLDNIRQEFIKAGVEGRQVFDELNSFIAQTEIPVRRTSGALQEMGTFLQNSFRWSVASGAINGLTREISKAFNYAQGLDKSLNSIQLVTGHSTDYMREFAQQANEAARALNASTLEYTNAALIYYQQGLSDKEVAERTATTLKMAQVSGESATKVSQQMTSIWNNFSNGIDNLERYADVMAGLGATTASSSGEIAKGLEKFASVAGTIGLSYDYAATAMATVTAQTRQSADSVGTSLKTLFSRLESLNLGKTLEDGVTLNKYSEALMKVGVNVLDANGQLKNMDSILEDLGGKWKNLTQAQQVALSQTVGGVRNYTTMVSLMENWDTFQQNLTTAQTSNGVLQRQADIYGQSWQASKQRLQTSAQGIYDTLISSDFFKGLNNVTANVLNIANNAGKTLGTPGTLAGLGMLGTYLYKDQISNGIDNAIANIWGQTQKGLASQYQTKLNNMMAADEKNGGEFAQARREIMSKASNAWSRFGNTRFESPADKQFMDSQLLLMQNQVENTSQLITQFEESTRNYTAATTDFKANLFSGFSTSNTQTITDIAERVQNMVDGIDSIAQGQGMVSNFYDKFGSQLSQFVKKSDGREFNSADQQAQRNLAKDLERYAKNLPNLSSNSNFQEVMKGLEQGKGFDLSTIGSLYQYTNVTAQQQINQGLESIAKDIFLGQNIQNAAVNKGLGGQYINDKNASIVQAYQQYIRDITQDSNKIGNFNPAWLNRESRAAYDKILENVKSQYNNTLSNAKQRYDVDTAVTRTVDTANQDTEALNNRRQGRQSIFQRMFGDGPAYKRNEQGQIAYRNAAGSTEYVDPKDLDKIKANAANQILYQEQTVGQFATNLSMATNSILMAGTSIHNFSESVKEGTATMSGFVSTTASSLLALGQINSILGNGGIVTGLNGTPLGLGKWVGKGYDVLGKGKLAALGTAETGATVAGLAIPAAVVLAAAAVGMDAISYAQAQSPERQLERVSELKAQSSSFAKEDQKKLNAFQSAFQEQLSSAAKLSSLQQGTAAYTSQLLTANEQARNLIETYGLQPGTDYTINEAGAITFSTNQLNDIYDRVEARAQQSAFEATVISGNYNLLNSQQNLDYIEHQLGGLIEPLTAAGAYDDALFELNQKYGNNVAYGSNYSINYASDLLDLYREDQENHHGIQLRGTEQEIQNLILQGQNILTQQQAQYQNMVNAYIGKQGDISDADKLAARALTINNLEGNLQSYLDAAGHKDTQNWFFGWGKNEAGVIYTRKGNDLVKRDDLIEQYKSLYGQDAIISADVTDEQLATQITAKVQENVIADAMKPFQETFQQMGSVVSDYANAGSLSRAAFNELLQNGQEIISQEGKKQDWGSLTHDAQQQIINDFLEENPQFKRPEDQNWLARTFGPYSDSAIEQGWGVLGSALQDLRKSNPNATLDTLYEEMGASFYNKNLERYGFVDSSMQEAYKILNQTAIADYADAVMKLAETVTINTTIDSQNFADLLNKSQMSNDELRMLNAYTSTIQATMGKETGRAVFEALSSYGTADRAWNKQFADALNKLDFSNNITGLASLYQQSGLLNSGNQQLTDNLDKLRKAIEKDISDKGGIGSTAFQTSDMQKVQAAVASALYEGTNVTTGDIAKMANKNATLSSYLDLTSDNGLRHYQSITDISSMIAQGQVSESSITDAFRQAVEDTGGTADLQQAGLDTLGQQNLGTSYSKVDDYWQNIGISWAQATRGNIAHDAPFMQAMSDILSTEQMESFRALMVSESLNPSNTKDINNALKDQMKPLYDLLSGTAGSGKYFGKGSGGIENAFTYFSALYGDQFSERGIDIDSKTGNITFNENFDEKYGDREFSSQGLYDYIKDTFKNLAGATYTETQAETFAKQMSGYIAATDVGYALDIGDAAEALNTYAQEATKRGYDYGENLDALLKSLEDAGFLDNLQYDEALGRFTGQKDGATAGTAEEIKQGFREAINGKGIPLLDKATSGFTSLSDLNTRFQSALNDSEVNGNSRQYDALNKVLESAVKNYTFTETSNGITSAYSGIYDYDSLRAFFGEQGYNSQDIDRIISEAIDKDNLKVAKQQTNVFGEDNNLYSWGQGKDYTGEDFVKQAKDAEIFNKAQELYNSNLLQQVMDEHFQNADKADDDFNSIFNDYRNKLEEQSRNAAQQNNGPEGELEENKTDENLSPNPDQNENGETPEAGSSTQTPNPSGPVSGMSQNDIDAIRGDYTHGYVNDKGDYVYVGPDGTTYRAVDLNAREEYLKEHPEQRINLSDQIKDAYNQHSNTISLLGGDVTVAEGNKIQALLKEISENTLNSADKLGELNEIVVDEEGNNKLTGGKGALQTNEKGQLVDEEGNLIELDENGNPIVKEETGSGGGGGSEPSEEPDYYNVGNNPGTDNTSKSAADALQAFIEGGGTPAVGDSYTDSSGYTHTYTDTDIQEAYQKVEQEKKGEDTGSNTATIASGQNNNLLPQFAAGTGTIAVTGELGPELHVKPNGDMDLLGKHGREYAWVEPNDKIYTAAQTASILGSKKIREMINGFSSGINNFIPGYFTAKDIAGHAGTQLGSSSSGGNFGGGGFSFGGGGEAEEAELTAENHRFDANWLKYRDILERYYTILQQLEDLANELQRFATLADRAWGKERIDNIERTIDIQEQQVVAQRAYLSEINTYLKEDKKTMTEGINEFVDQWKEMYPNRPLGFEGATFDENGVLTNYRQIVETMLDAYNMDVNGYTYASGNYSVGAAGAMGSGLFSLIAGAVAQAIGSGGAKYGMSKRVTGDFFAAGQNNDDAQDIVIESVTTKSQANAQQTVLEEKLKDIQFYTQTLNLYQQQLTVLEQMQQQLFDTRLQAIQVEVEYKVSLKNNALNLLDYALSKVKDDAYMAAEAVSLIGQEQDINISILEDYEKELKDILNLNLNGEAFFGSDDYTLVPTMETSQLEKDLDTIAKMHEKFWDEETQSYRDHYIENLETGEITFEDPEAEEDNDRNLSKSVTDILTSVDRGIISTDEEKNQRHTMDEYNSLIARLYEKYYANYSQYLPDPEEFLQFTNSKERLKYLEQQSTGEEDKSSSRGGITLNTRGQQISIGSTASGEGAVDTPDYLYLIENADDALDRLNMLSEILNRKTIHADIDKFTSEFKNLDEVSNSLQNIFDGLIEDFPKLGENIQNTNSDLIHFDETTDKWLLDIDSYSEAIEVLDQINKTNRQKLTDEKFEQFKEDPMAFWEWMTDMSENFDFTNFTANEIQMLNQLSTTYLSSIANLKDSVLTQIDYLGNSVKTYAKDMDTVFNEFDHYKNLYADWQNIIDLTGRQTTKLGHDLIVELNTNVVDNSINKLKSAKEQVDAMTHMQNLAQAQYLQAQAELEAFQGDDEQRYWLQNIVDEYKANIDKINKETEEAEDAYMKSWEDALQGLATAFQQTIKDAAAGFEESFSPIYHTFDALSGALERQRNLRDLYLRPYDQAHGLSQIARDIKESILDTDNLNSKRELKKLLDEVNDAQEEGVELSSYDLDIMQKKYDLELARAALEDAKNAKSLVRLARDNNGNWSYVYTANEDDVDEAEQRYEDAILAMEQTNENYIDSLQDQLLQVLANAEAQITALNPSDFANEEEYFDRVKEIQDLANTQIAFIQEQMENAFANNNYLLDNVSGKAADIMKDLTTSYDNTLLAMLTGSDSIGSLAALSVDNIGTLVDQAMQAYNDFWTRNAEVWKEAGHDVTDASTTISEAMDTISQDSINNVDEMGKVVGRAVNAFDKLNQVLVINAGKIYDVAANYETLAASINKIIELSSEYIKQNTLTIDTNIHGWEQLDDIYSRLSTDGSVWIKYLDENNEEQIKFLSAGTQDTMDWLQNQREFLVNLLKDQELDQYQFSTQAALDDYYNDIDDILKAHGRMNLDIKGELLDAILSTEDEELTGLKNYFDNINKLIDEEGNRLEDGDEFGLLTLDWVNNKEQVELILQLLKRFLEVKKEEAESYKSSSNDSGPGWYELNTALYGTSHKDNPTGWDENNLYGDTGMYTGRWQSMDTGGYSGNWYTGEWPNGSVRRNGRLAWLHQKELVLNAHDTENFLDAMEIVRQLDNLTNWMANGLGVLAPTNIDSEKEILQQEVNIHAEFPNVTDHHEIEDAMNNLVNMASQYVNRR